MQGKLHLCTWLSMDMHKHHFLMFGLCLKMRLEKKIGFELRNHEHCIMPKPQTEM
jgi:hypothetical protein